MISPPADFFAQRGAESLLAEGYDVAACCFYYGKGKDLARF